MTSVDSVLGFYSTAGETRQVPGAFGRELSSDRFGGHFSAEERERQEEQLNYAPWELEGEEDLPYDVCVCGRELWSRMEVRMHLSRCERAQAEFAADRARQEQREAYWAHEEAGLY